MIIAIDGPAGSGKTTVAKKTAERLGFVYLDTGAMYRAITWKALRDGVGLTDEPGLAELARTSEVDFSDGSVLIDGFDVSEAIRLPDVGAGVSLVSRVAAVRTRLVEKQRQAASRFGNIVVEGRDIGTVVFPEAEVKIFLTARSRERAQRRLKELRRKGLTVEAGAIEAELKTRDRLDAGRQVSPLERAEDAHLIDATERTADQVVEEILKLAARCSTG